MLSEDNTLHLIIIKLIEKKLRSTHGTMLPSTGACRTKVSVQLNSGTKPSWSTHSGGFAVDFDVQDQRAGWGTTNAKCLIFLDTFNWVQGSESPVSYTQMTKASLPVLFLRGGGKYHVSTDYQVTWQVHDKDYTWTSGRGELRDGCGYDNRYG